MIDLKYMYDIMKHIKVLLFHPYSNNTISKRLKKKRGAHIMKKHKYC